MENHWGICTKEGRLLLNPNLTIASKMCTEYVSDHELCHLKEHNHTTRAERVRAAEPEIYANLNPEQREFVEFVLSRYIETGVEVLDRELLPELLKLKYEAIEDAIAVFGNADVIKKTFTEFQRHLYSALAS